MFKALAVQSLDLVPNKIDLVLSWPKYMLNLLSTNTGLVSSRDSLTSWGEGASSALVGHPFSDGVTIKIPYGVDVLLYQPT